MAGRHERSEESNATGVAFSRVQTPLIMGIVNVTPDSFSDGGAYFDHGAAAAHAEELIAAGADVVDCGAESSRPGAKPVPEAEEWRRLSPLLERLARSGAKAQISVDTYKPEIMRRAADHGATFINDIRGAATLSDAFLAELAQKGMSYIAMHLAGDPQTMQQSPLSGAQAYRSVSEFFTKAGSRLKAAGFPPERIWLDPGIGFGKDDSGNLSLLRLAIEQSASANVVVGVSRKAMLGRMLGIDDPKARDAPSKTLELGLMLAGVSMIRTHAVADLARMRSMWQPPNVVPAKVKH
jgi:dihydropteroate synthase